jgi:serine/threonine protein phosphatase PrpC
MLPTSEIAGLFYHGKVYLSKSDSEEGKRIYALSRDHKPCDELEKRRIVEAGG